MSDLHNPIDPRRAHHDMGGLPAAAVEATEHDYALWVKRIDAILTLLSNEGPSERKASRFFAKEQCEFTNSVLPTAGGIRVAVAQTRCGNLPNSRTHRQEHHGLNHAVPANRRGFPGIQKPSQFRSDSAACRG